MPLTTIVTVIAPATAARRSRRPAGRWEAVS